MIDLHTLFERIAWASVGPGHRRTWQEVWRWAGALLEAEEAAA